MLLNMKIMGLLGLFLFVGCRTLGNIPAANLGAWPSPTPSTNYNPTPSYYAPESKVKKDYKSEFAQSIDGYEYQDSSIAYMSTYPNSAVIKEHMKALSIEKSAPDNCYQEREYKHYIVQHKDDLQRDRFLKFQASSRDANYVYLIDSKYLNDKYFLTYKIYFCSKGPIKPLHRELREKSDSQVEFDFMLGSYVNRNGFLKSLGDVGPTVGFNLMSFNKNNYSKIFNLDLGWYLHFSLDHFFNTDSSFLQPKFIDENYTNYMWSLGPVFRYSLSKEVKLNYAVGPAINFLEMDTNGTNQTLTDDEATRTTFSMTHQLGLYYYLDGVKKTSRNTSAFGINLLYYYMPDALGEWARNNSDLDDYGGGSFSFMFSFKTITF